ncbi:hypothetical protein Droror1_Dr00026385 [Drosera rotundifolia]
MASSSSMLIKVVFAVVACMVLAAPLVKAHSPLYCDLMRPTPPYTCRWFLKSGKKENFNFMCDWGMNWISWSETRVPELAKADCYCFNKAINNTQKYNATSFFDLVQLSNVSLPYKMDGTTNCSTL